MSPDRRIPLYDSKVPKTLEEEGLSSEEAIRVASTEMEGANEKPTGEISSTQTACPILRYPETLPESKGAKEGKEATEKGIRETFSLEKDKDIDSFVDEWIRDQEKQLKNN